VRRNAPTIRLRTRRGLVVEGAEEHRLSIGPDQWLALKDVRVGQPIALSVGDDIWAKEYVAVELPLRSHVFGNRAGATAVAATGLSVSRWLNGERTHESGAIAVAVKHAGYGVDSQQTRALLGARLPVTVPACVDEALGEFLGYLIGAGNGDLSKAAIGFTT